LEESCCEATGVAASWRILVVEDEVLIRLMIADILMQAGFHVIQAASADEALKVLHSSVGVDLVMTDIRMPGSLDGLELARRVRANWPSLKVVILSSEYPDALANARADAWICKPFRPTDVVDHIKQLLGPRNDTP